MMVEWRQILRRAERSRDGALATLVGIQGSSYRRVGARLLLVEGEEPVGSISGGCLEEELVTRAKWLTQNGAVVKHYSTAYEDTDDIPYGLGCGGELDLLLERVDSVEVQQLLAAVKQALGGVRQRVVTWLPGNGRPLRRAIFDVEAEWVRQVTFASEGLSESEIQWAAMADGRREMPPSETVFLEVIEPPQRLVIFGAGEDARPLVALGALLGWTVVVADGRRQMARRERFPAAEQVVVLRDGEGVTLTTEDAVVLMTHSYEQDRTLLEKALPVMPKYLGLLGARHRSSLLVSEVATRLGWTVERCCERLYAPVGLDLGGDGAEAIALAAIAEIQASVQGRLGLSQRLRPQDVAEQTAEGGAEIYLGAQCALRAQ